MKYENLTYEDLVFKYKLASDLYSEVKDFRGKYFSDVVFDIEGVDLSGAVLYGCYCPHENSALKVNPLDSVRGIEISVDLNPRSRSRSEYFKADFSNGRFRNSSLMNTTWTASDFRGVTFVNTDLDDIIFESCKLDNATFNLSRFLNHFKAERSSFNDSQFSGVYFGTEGYTLVKFYDCELTNSSFKFTDIVNSRFNECDLRNSLMVAKSEFINMRFDNCDLKSAYIEIERDYRSFTTNSFHRCNLINTQFGENAAKSIKNGWNYRTADMFEGSLISDNIPKVYCGGGAVYVGPNQDFTKRGNFAAKDISGVNLENCKFGSKELSETNFQNCNLQNVDFRNAELDYAEFQGADLRDADLRGANLNKTEYDRSTRLPDTITKEQLDSMLFMEDED